MRTSLGPGALRDIRTVSDYLARESPRLAVRFADQIASARATLAMFPDCGSSTGRSTIRYVILKDFPYKVFYKRIAANEIRIMRVRHARRRPMAWE